MSAAGAYETVIGLEVHAHLLTRSKMFCGCSTAFGAEPNSQTCPVCQGMPGVLPVINRRAVELGIRTALALGCRVNQHNRFARKHYYYPDMPKNYQISQYEEPLAEHGMLEVEVGGATRTIGIQRLHLEEDVGKLIHEGTLETAPASNVDFNRAGVPLMEIVSKPDLRSPEEAGAYLKTLRGMVRFLQVCDGNMEEGSLRCDANVSIRPRGTAELGTKVEIKNLNSFRHVQHALEYEVTRQTRALETGEALVQETRLWNADTGRTVSMRSKEYAHDYRYFPEPDLPPLSVEERWVEEIRRGSPKLAEFYQKTLVEQYGISVHEARLATPSAAMAEYVLTTVSGSPNPKAAMNWILNEVYHVVDPEDEQAVRTFSIPAANLIGLLRLTADGTISGKIAKDVFDKMRTGEDAATIVRREGLTQVADAGELGTVVDQVLAQNPKVVDDWKKGKTAALGFLVGQVMKATSGKANPALVNTLLGEKLPRL